MIEPLLPNKPPGVSRVDDRRVLNDVFGMLRSGAPWRDLAQALWSAHHLLQPLRAMAKGRRVGWLMDAITDAHGGVIQIIDSTSVCAHQQAATLKWEADHRLGRSRGGLTIKIQVVVEAQASASG